MINRFLYLIFLINNTFKNGKILIFITDPNISAQLQIFLKNIEISSVLIIQEYPVLSRVDIIKMFNENKFNILISSDYSLIDEIKKKKNKIDKYNEEKKKDNENLKNKDNKDEENINNDENFNKKDNEDVKLMNKDDEKFNKKDDNEKLNKKDDENFHQKEFYNISRGIDFEKLAAGIYNYYFFKLIIL
jgi:hypothetical protein